MCGIVGYISTRDEKYIEEKRHFMHFALTLDTLRGFDSTGIINVDQRFRVTTQRSLMAGDRFVHSKHYKKDYQDAWCKIGHNRAATIGNIKLKNTHPFNFGPITLVHNGTLAHKGASLPTFDHTLTVDSMQIALALSQGEPNEAAKILETIDGSFAIVWTDQRNESVNMARNSDRPIHYAWNRTKDIMWFMSDGLHLKTINKSLWKTPCEGHTVFQMDKYKILTFRKGTVVPVVTAFRPFVRTQRNTSGPIKTGGSPTALQRATDKWSETIKGQGAGASGTGVRSGLRAIDMRIQVSGKSRRLLVTHLSELHREFDLKPTRYLEFSPVIKYVQKNGRYTVLGDIVHDEWGDSEWDAVIYDVKPALANAYDGQNWTINPVGLSRPHVIPDKVEQATVPSVLCKLVNCDWEQFKPMEGPPDPKVETDNTSPILVLVGDMEIEVARLDKLLDSGCVSCTAAMTMDDTGSALIVNDGRDLLCGGCLATLNGSKLRDSLDESPTHLN